MAIPQPVTADEKRWQAESDARTLSEAKIITADEKRMTAAQAAADRLAEERREEAEALKKVADVKSGAVAKAKKMFPNTEQ